MSAPAISTPAATTKPASRWVRRRRASSLLAHGEPAVWGTGGGLAVALTMIIGLLVLVVIQGGETFWSGEVVQVRTVAGNTYLGDVVREENFKPEANVFASLPVAAKEKAQAEVDKAGGVARRRLLRTGNYDLTGTHHHWVSDFEITEESRPEWVLVIERLTWGNFYGTPVAYLVNGKVTASEPSEIWAEFNKHHAEVRDRRTRRINLERHDLGEVRRMENDARLEMRQAEIDHGKGSAEHVAAAENYAEVKRKAKVEEDRIKGEITTLNWENDHHKMKLVTADGQETILPLAQIVRAYPANQLSFGDKLGVYFSRWGEFLSDRPREANTEGGVFPAIWGTVAMTLLMSLAVVPFGVLAALYLREYAKSGPIISAVRIAINNLAGVPSIVFGVFGLGFFCYLMGAFIDGGPERIQVAPWPARTWWLAFLAAVVLGTGGFFAGLASRRYQTKMKNEKGNNSSFFLVNFSFWCFALWVVSLVMMLLLIIKTPYFQGLYQANLPNPTFGTGGLLWASLTLALLTLPVVIVATEEALSAVPNSMREGSYACGASKWQTIRRIVLPRAMPGIMTGMILAIARGAGEVAPLMLVGAVKLAPELPLDGVFPFLHGSRSFMHLGFHIYDVGFQSPNSEAARPMVFTTTLLLIGIVALLNITAIWLRSRLRRRYQVSQF